MTARVTRQTKKKAFGHSREKSPARAGAMSDTAAAPATTCRRRDGSNVRPSPEGAGSRASCRSPRRISRQ
eukprot:2550876-Pyramimonas_sp.AAC.1